MSQFNAINVMVYIPRGLINTAVSTLEPVGDVFLANNSYSLDCRLTLLLLQQLLFLEREEDSLRTNSHQSALFPVSYWPVNKDV